MMIDDETFKTQIVVFAWAFFIESLIFKIIFVELEDEPGWDAMIFASWFCAIAISLAAYIDSIINRDCRQNRFL